jgi:hypothetical protein
MKKVLLSFGMFYLTSLAAIAGNELTSNPGDPKKEKEKQSGVCVARRPTSYSALPNPSKRSPTVLVHQGM